MAFSSALKKRDVQGTVQVHVYDVNLAAVTTGHIKTGLSNIVFADCNNETTAGGRVKINRNSADDAVEMGGVLLVGFTSNDVGSVMVYGN
jgi:hypothetical protein